MDFQRLEDEATKSLSRLPKELLTSIASVVIAHKEALIANFPLIIDDLKPHVVAAIMEGGMGILDKDELEATMMRVLSHFGVTMPKDIP